jgi:hypothetical protein
MDEEMFRFHRPPGEFAVIVMLLLRTAGMDEQENCNGEYAEEILSDDQYCAYDDGYCAVTRPGNEGCRDVISLS